MIRTIIKSLTCYFFSLLAINNTFADGEWWDYQQFEENPQDTTKSNSEMQDWVQQETDWWDHQQQVLSEKIPQETPKKNKSQFKLTAKYWEKIKPYFFKNNIYVGYCVLDAYNDSLPLIITKVRNKTAYSISVDVNVYAKDINNTRDLKLCHTEDLLNAYAWDDSQSVRYNSPECIYEMYFKLCPLSDYPKSEIPGILVPLSLETTKQKISDDKLKKSKDLNKMLKDGMEAIWEKEQEEAWDKKTKDIEIENSQILNSPEVIAWQEWFKGSLNALKAVTFDFKKNVIDPVCTEETFNTLFQKYFGKINQIETISQQAQQEKEQFYQEIENLRVQLTQSENLEKELRAEIEKLKTDLSKTPTKSKTIDVIKTTEPVYETKDGRKIGKLKRVNGDNILDSIKQYQDDSKNEKSNLTEDSIQQMQEVNRQKMLEKAKENIESSKRAEAERAKGIQQFGSTASNITEELNQISNGNEDFDPKEALKRIKNKNYIKKEPKEIKPNIEPKKLKLDTNFKQNMESIWGGKQPSKPIENTTEGTHKPTPRKIQIDPSFAEKLQNDLGAKRTNQPVQEPVTQETESSFYIPPAPVLNLQQESTTQTSIPTPPPLNLNSDKTLEQTQQEFYIPQAPKLELPTSSNPPKELNNKHELGKRQKTFNRS